MLYNRRAMMTLTVHIAVKEEGDFIGHCLELDLVEVATTEDNVVRLLVDLIETQISYAIENNNLDHLFKSAPEEVLRGAERGRLKVVQRQFFILRHFSKDKDKDRWEVTTCKG